MHRSRFGGIIIDCSTDDPEQAADFWSAALGYPKAVRTPGSQYVALTSPRNETYVEVQAVRHASRVHLDIETDDLEAEVGRLERLGASKVAAVGNWVVMQAPSGQRFCVVPVANEHFDATANTWE
ncbi:MAG: VOC family protein [Pseudomonadota bacterium]